MIWILSLGYLAIAGAIAMDRGHQLDHARRIVRKKLSPFGVAVDITLRDDDSWNVTATKQIGINVKHAVVDSISAVTAVNLLVSDVQQNFDQWTDPDKYGG